MALRLEDVVSAGARRGLTVRRSGRGPLFRLEAVRAGGKLAGELSGAVLPGGRVHVESYRAAAREGGGLLGVSPGMLLFMGAIALGGERGCGEVYGLAIEDGEEQHRRLVRYLRRFGGVEVRKVGDGLKDVPDRLLYGGRGTVVRGDIGSMLERAEGMLRRTEPPVEEGAEE